MVKPPAPPGPPDPSVATQERIKSGSPWLQHTVMPFSYLHAHLKETVFPRAFGQGTQPIGMYPHESPLRHQLQ